jgi:hypothetical protein
LGGALFVMRVGWGAQEEKRPEEVELEGLKKSLEDTQPIGSLIKAARTLDQARAVPAPL